MKVNKSFTMCYYDRLIEFLRKLGIKSNYTDTLEAFWLIRGYDVQENAEPFALIVSFADSFGVLP